MLNKLKKLIKRHGIVVITGRLGYRSTQTVTHWLNNNHIPELAREKVKNLIKELG
jgi:DNA-binding LacI/PurR family transcriptional regulator